MDILTKILIGAIGIWVGYWLATRNRKSSSEYLGTATQKEKERRKEEIIKLLEKRGRIANNDVETLLKVSDATATNYLQELEEQNKIKQVGKEGRSVYYELK